MQLETLDQEAAALMRRLNEHKRRRAFYLGFAARPYGFIKALIASQVGFVVWCLNC